jgi:proline utilization trans-activator
VATRPLLLSVIKVRLERLGRRDLDWENFLAHTTTLISTGIKSAVKTLQILSEEDSLLGGSYIQLDCGLLMLTFGSEVFLPFDLEFTYAAALHLIMANAIFPGVAYDQGYTQQALDILDEMIKSGNKVAEVRKAELVHLEGLCQELVNESEQRGHQMLTLGALETSDQVETQDSLTGVDPILVPDLGAVTVAPVGEIQSTPSSFDPQMTNSFEFLDNIGISSSEFLSIADQLGHQDLLTYSALDSRSN